MSSGCSIAMLAGRPESSWLTLLQRWVVWMAVSAELLAELVPGSSTSLKSPTPRYALALLCQHDSVLCVVPLHVARSVHRMKVQRPSSSTGGWMGTLAGPSRLQPGRRRRRLSTQCRWPRARAVVLGPLPTFGLSWWLRMGGPLVCCRLKVDGLPSSAGQRTFVSCPAGT